MNLFWEKPYRRADHTGGKGMYHRIEYNNGAHWVDLSQTQT